MTPQASSRRPASSFLLAGLALALVGVGLFLIGSASADGGPEVSGGNVGVNRRAGDQLDLSAHNSPTLVRDPLNLRRLVVVNRVDAPRFSCALHVSTDGGATWADRPIPFPAGEEQPPRCFAPDAGFAPDGTLHVSFVTLKGLGNVPNAVWVVSAPPGEDGLSTPVQVSGPFAFQVRLVVDDSSPGRLYASWLQAVEPPATLGFSGPGNRVVVARSDDGGATWGQPVEASEEARLRPLAPAPAVDRRGTLYVLYLDLGDDRLDYQAAHEGRGGEPYPGKWSLLLARSSDRGATWQETVVDPSLVPIDRLIAFFPPFPSLAIDPDGRRVYAAFHDGRAGDADVLVWRSSDAGRSFRGTARVNDTKSGDGTSQYMPKVAVAPGGRVDVVYYDRRADPDNRMNEVSLQSSDDGAARFGDRLRLSDKAFDSRVGFGSERDLPDLGSRLALYSEEERAVAAWTDTRAGTVASGKQNIALAVVEFEESSAFAPIARLAGVALIVLGALLTDAGVRRTFRKSSGDRQQTFSKDV